MSPRGAGVGLFGLETDPDHRLAPLLLMSPAIRYTLIVAALLLIVYVIWRVLGRKKSGYAASISPEKRDIVHLLVTQVAPKLSKGQAFDRADLERISGLPKIDPELYFRFKTLFETDQLTEDKLVYQLEHGGR